MQQIQDTQLQKAQALALMGSQLPQAYRGPGGTGAMLLAIDFATRNDIDIIDVIRWVSFVNGKPIIETDLAVKIANRQGIKVEVRDLDDAAEARLIGPDGTEHKWWRYTLADAKKAGLLDREGPWTTHPKVMLRHRARKHALQFDGPMIGGVVIPAELDDDDVRTAELERADDSEQATPEPEQVLLVEDPVEETMIDPWAKVSGSGPSSKELRETIQRAGWERSDVNNWLKQENLEPGATATKLADTPVGKALMAVLVDDVNRIS